MPRVVDVSEVGVVVVPRLREEGVFSAAMLKTTLGGLHLMSANCPQSITNHCATWKFVAYLKMAKIWYTIDSMRVDHPIGPETCVRNEICKRQTSSAG